MKQTIFLTFLNHILLVYRSILCYRSREKHILNINILMDKLTEIKKKKKRISFARNNKTKTNNKNGALQMFYHSDTLWRA